LMMEGTTGALPTAYKTSWTNLTLLDAWQAMRGFDDNPGVDWPGGYRHGKHTVATNVFVSTTEVGAPEHRVGNIRDLCYGNGFTNNTYFMTGKDATWSSLFYTMRLAPGAWDILSYSQWTNLVNVSEGVSRYGDPLIGSDYTLTAGSPALDMGFQQIDLSNVGTYASEWLTDGPDPGPKAPGPTPPSGTRMTIRGKAVLGGRVR